MAVSPGAVWFSRRQLMSGSCTNASSIAMTLSLLDLRTDMTPSHVLRKLPSMPLTSIARTSILVSRNGTRSGNFSLCIEASKQSPKSMCRILPLYRSNIRLLGCLSPRPKRYPTMDITASERVYVVRLSSHVSEDRDLSHRTLARSLPGVFSSACSNTSTCVDETHAGLRVRVRVKGNHERVISRSRRQREKRTRVEEKRRGAGGGNGDGGRRRVAQSLRCSIRPHRRRAVSNGGSAWL